MKIRYFILILLLVYNGCNTSDSESVETEIRLSINGDISDLLDERLLVNYRTIFNIRIDSDNGEIDPNQSVNNLAILTEQPNGDSWDLYFRFFEPIEEKSYTSNYSTLLQLRDEGEATTFLYDFTSLSGELRVREFNADYILLDVDIPLELTNLVERDNTNNQNIQVDNYDPMSVRLEGRLLLDLN